MKETQREEKPAGRGIGKWICDFLGIRDFGRQLKTIGHAVYDLLQFPYFDIVLLLIVFYIIADQEMISIRRNTMWYTYMNEKKLTPVVLENFMLLCVPLLFLKRRLYAIYVSLFIPLTFIPVLLQTFLAATHGFVFDTAIFNVVMAASPQETFAYIRSLPVTFWTLGSAFVIMIAGLCMFSIIQAKKRIGLRANRFVILLLLCPMAGVAIYAGIVGEEKCTMISQSSGIQALVRGFYLGLEETQEYRRAAQNPVLPDKVRCADDDSDVLGVILIGESATRNRFAIYGNDRDTTPNLFRLKDELLVFRNAICRERGTPEAIHSIFYLEDGGAQRKGNCYFPAIMKEAGFRQKFFSAQSNWSKWDSTKFIFTDREFEEIVYKPNDFDEILIPFVQREDELNAVSGRTLLYLHAYGSHVFFPFRVPKEKKVFAKGYAFETGEASLAEYDDTIHYTDECIGKIIDTLKTSRRPAFLLYFSDHGESIYTGLNVYVTVKFRDSKAPECYEVPLILWANDAFRKKHPDLWENGQQNVDKPFCTDTLIWSMLSLCGVTFDGFEYDKDLFSGRYQSQENRLPYQHWNEIKKATPPRVADPASEDREKSDFQMEKRTAPFGTAFSKILNFFEKASQDNCEKSQ